METPAWIAEDPLSKREAWVDYLALLREGEDLSVRQWADRWRWSKSQAGRFLKRLQDENLTELEAGTVEEVQFGLGLPGFPETSPVGSGTVGNGVAWPRRSLLGRDKRGRIIWPESFERIWAAYPRSGTKFTAYNGVRDAILGGSSEQDILDGIEAYLEAHEDRDEKYLHAAHNFFNQRVWDDDHESAFGGLDDLRGGEFYE